MFETGLPGDQEDFRATSPWVSKTGHIPGRIMLNVVTKRATKDPKDSKEQNDVTAYISKKEASLYRKKYKTWLPMFFFYAEIHSEKDEYIDSFGEFIPPISGWERFLINLIYHFKSFVTSFV